MYGTKAGQVHIFDSQSDPENSKGIWNLPKAVSSTDDSNAVKEIVHSPGEDVFIAVRGDGMCILYGIDYDKVEMMFETTQGSLSRLVWIDNVSGDFLAAYSNAGVLRVFNAAYPSCKEIIKVSRHGIQDIKRMSNEIYLLRLKNGQITQF